MKILRITLIMLLVLFFTACDLQHSSVQTSIDKSYSNLSNESFEDTDMVYEVISKKEDYLEKVRILLKIDDRLKNLSHVSDIKQINLLIRDKEGIDKNGTGIYWIDSVKINKKNDVLLIDLYIFPQRIRNIDIIAVSFFLNNSTNQVMENTDTYFYKNSANLLGLDNTFMDSTGFKKANVLIDINKLSIKNNYLNEIGLTIKVSNQEINDITDIQVNIWSNKESYRLNFVRSIFIGKVSEKIESSQCQLLSVSRPGGNYIYYGINILPLKLKKIDYVEVKLNDKLYYSNKLADN